MFGKANSNHTSPCHELAMRASHTATNPHCQVDDGKVSDLLWEAVVGHGVDVLVFCLCRALIKTLLTMDCGLEGTEVRLSEVKLCLESSHNIVYIQ